MGATVLARHVGAWIPALKSDNEKMLNRLCVTFHILSGAVQRKLFAYLFATEAQLLIANLFIKCRRVPLAARFGRLIGDVNRKFRDGKPCTSR